jgi:2-phospho-L-lactate/phosphoenolpyruvate guanylyltransferase
MSLWAIIPVKPFVRAKSRLSEVLTPDERSRLAEYLLRHVLTVVRAVPQIAGTLVISRDSKVLAIARDMGANTVMESGQPELNRALMRATQVVASWKGSAVLILPADLPLVAPEDVSAVIELGRRPNTVVLATDDQEDGTNAMLVRPPGIIPYAYGAGSFKRHMEAAILAGANVHRYDSQRLQLDIDLPEDLERFYSTNGKHKPLFEAASDNAT